MDKQATNTFKDGMIMDSNPLAVSDSQLTSVLNGTTKTFNGNESMLLNDMGNGRIERVRLDEGYIPTGITEYGGVIYVTSVNPETGKGQIGSFPFPQLLYDILKDSDFIEGISFDTNFYPRLSMYKEDGYEQEFPDPIYLFNNNTIEIKLFSLKKSATKEDGSIETVVEQISLKEGDSFIFILKRASDVENDSSISESEGAAYISDVVTIYNLLNNKYVNCLFKIGDTLIDADLNKIFLLEKDSSESYLPENYRIYCPKGVSGKLSLVLTLQTINNLDYSITLEALEDKSNIKATFTSDEQYLFGTIIDNTVSTMEPGNTFSVNKYNPYTSINTVLEKDGDTGNSIPYYIYPYLGTYNEEKETYEGRLVDGTHQHKYIFPISKLLSEGKCLYKYKYYVDSELNVNIDWTFFVLKGFDDKTDLLYDSTYTIYHKFININSILDTSSLDTIFNKNNGTIIEEYNNKCISGEFSTTVSLTKAPYLHYVYVLGDDIGTQIMFVRLLFASQQYNNYYNDENILDYNDLTPEILEVDYIANSSTFNTTAEYNTYYDTVFSDGKMKDGTKCLNNGPILFDNNYIDPDKYNNFATDITYTILPADSSLQNDNIDLDDYIVDNNYQLLVTKSEIKFENENVNDSPEYSSDYNHDKIDISTSIEEKTKNNITYKELTVHRGIYAGTVGSCEQLTRTLNELLPLIDITQDNITSNICGFLATSTATTGLGISRRKIYSDCTKSFYVDKITSDTSLVSGGTNECTTNQSGTGQASIIAETCEQNVTENKCCFGVYFGADTDSRPEARISLRKHSSVNKQLRNNMVAGLPRWKYNEDDRVWDDAWMGISCRNAVNGKYEFLPLMSASCSWFSRTEDTTSGTYTYYDSGKNNVLYELNGYQWLGNYGSEDDEFGRISYPPATQRLNTLLSQIFTLQYVQKTGYVLGPMESSTMYTLADGSYIEYTINDKIATTELNSKINTILNDTTYDIKNYLQEIKLVGKGTYKYGVLLNLDSDLVDNILNKYLNAYDPELLIKRLHYHGLDNVDEYHMYVINISNFLKTTSEPSPGYTHKSITGSSKAISAVDPKHIIYLSYDSEGLTLKADCQVVLTTSANLESGDFISDSLYEFLEKIKGEITTNPIIDLDSIEIKEGELPIINPVNTFNFPSSISPIYSFKGKYYDDTDEKTYYIMPEGYKDYINMIKLANDAYIGFDVYTMGYYYEGDGIYSLMHTIDSNDTYYYTADNCNSRVLDKFLGNYMSLLDWNGCIWTMTKLSNVFETVRQADKEHPSILSINNNGIVLKTSAEYYIRFKFDYNLDLDSISLRDIDFGAYSPYTRNGGGDLRPFWTNYSKSTSPWSGFNSNKWVTLASFRVQAETDGGGSKIYNYLNYVLFSLKHNYITNVNRGDEELYVITNKTNTTNNSTSTSNSTSTASTTNTNS